MRHKRPYYIRKAHRYLGLVLGIQFLFWTLSGLYFSWTNIDEIHGDFERKKVPLLSAHFMLVSPSTVLLQNNLRADSIKSVQLVALLGEPYYHLQFFSGGKLHQALADARSGKQRPQLNRNEAVAVATNHYSGNTAVKNVAYLTAANNHHEYREKPLPAWAITFRPSGTTVYVSAHTGQVESIRTGKWRLFDFLWMTHTMDYQSRDNINNWLLRVFSIFGLVTVLSGFALYWVSSRRHLRKRPPLPEKTTVV